MKPSDIDLTKPLRTLVGFATRWGAQFGGINVFNSEFLARLAFAYRGRVRVFCVVVDATSDEIERARTGGVTVISLGKPSAQTFDPSDVQATLARIASGIGLTGYEGVIWLGHDRVTGAIALAARDAFGGKATLVHHMSYRHYEAFAESASLATTKMAEQADLFRRADYLLAVGPLLRDALAHMVPQKTVTSIVPGLDEITPVPSSNLFTAIITGRLSPDAARIKQGHLAVAGFADAVRRAHAEPGRPASLRGHPLLILRGVELEPSASESRLESADWSLFADDYAGRVVNVHALPFTSARAELLEQLCGASVAMMPSWHEGFGLAGWEAIAAGVPLILSEKSGLYQLLQEESGGSWLAWVFGVDVRGQSEPPFFQPQDLARVSDLVIEIASDPRGVRDKASRLREAISTRFTWKYCVDEALRAMDLEALLISPATESSLVETRAVISEEETQSIDLEMPRPRWKLGVALAESQLLRAEEAAVPFDPTGEPGVEELVGWATTTEHEAALRLVVGSGGSGKTRLAIELCHRLIAKGWHCGFIPSGLTPARAVDLFSRVVTRSRPCLAVFDYAETRQDLIVSFLRALLSGVETRNVRVRLLLLARSGGEWWDRLPSRDAICQPFLNGYATSGPFTIPALHATRQQRRIAFDNSLAAYSRRLGEALPGSLEIDLSGDHFDLPLFVQMAALLAIRGERRSTAEGLTRALLQHEYRYWRLLLNSDEVASTVRQVDDRHAAELMTIATLAGGLARPVDAANLWRKWQSSLGADLDGQSIRTLFHRLASLYQRDRGLSPLRPDLLGEALVAHSLLQQTGVDLLDALWDHSASHSVRRSALTVIARLSNYRGDAETAVVDSLGRQFVPAALDVTHVAPQIESRLPQWSEKAFSALAPAARDQAVGLLMPAIWHQSVRLAELACAISAAEVDRRAVKARRRPNDANLQGAYAYSLVNHSVDLTRAGRNPLEAAAESVRLYELLAVRDAKRFTLDLANAFATYANGLAQAGAQDEAITYSSRAVRIVETHLESRRIPEADAARILNAHANLLSRSDRAFEAIDYSRRALAIREKLAHRDETSLARWLQSIYTHAGLLSSTGDAASALEYATRAIKSYEELIASKPDRFEPEFIDVLATYVQALAEAGHYADAVENSRRRVKIARRLSEKNAARFEFSLASSLADLALRLTETGDYSEAAVAIREGCTIRERLVETAAERVAVDLAWSNVAVVWIEWLATGQCAAANITAAAAELAVPERSRLILQCIRSWSFAWVLSTNDAERADYMSYVLASRPKLSAEQFLRIEELWITAAAWWESSRGHPPLPEMSTWRDNWRLFLKRTNGRLPAWMQTLSDRLAIEWPAGD